MDERLIDSFEIQNFSSLKEREFFMSKIKYADKFIKFESPLKELSSFDLYYIKQKLGYRQSAIYSNQFMYCRKFYAIRLPKSN
jgi:hypothetical protein